MSPPSIHPLNLCLLIRIIFSLATATPDTSFEDIPGVQVNHSNFIKGRGVFRRLSYDDKILQGAAFFLNCKMTQSSYSSTQKSSIKSLRVSAVSNMT